MLIPYNLFSKQRIYKVNKSDLTGDASNASHTIRTRTWWWSQTLFKHNGFHSMKLYSVFSTKLDSATQNQICQPLNKLSISTAVPKWHHGWQKKSAGQNPCIKMYPLTEFEAEGIFGAHENSNSAFRLYNSIVQHLEHYWKKLETPRRPWSYLLQTKNRLT
jgi:hypothetical protein